MFAHRPRLIVIAVLVVLPMACSRGPARKADVAPLAPVMDRALGPEGGVEIPWRSPIPGGRVVGSVTEAQQAVGFAVKTPNLGTPPEVIQVGAGSDVSGRGVAFVFRSPEAGGYVVLTQSLPQLTQTQLLARTTSDDFPAGTFQAVQIRGTQGLLIRGGTEGRLQWIEKGVMFDLLGEHLPAITALQLAATL